MVHFAGCACEYSHEFWQASLKKKITICLSFIFIPSWFADIIALFFYYWTFAKKVNSGREEENGDNKQLVINRYINLIVFDVCTMEQYKFFCLGFIRGFVPEISWFEKNSIFVTKKVQMPVSFFICRFIFNKIFVWIVCFAQTSQGKTSFFSHTKNVSLHCQQFT